MKWPDRRLTVFDIQLKPRAALPLQEGAHHLLKGLIAPQEWAGDPPLQRLAVLVQAEVQLLAAYVLLIENSRAVKRGLVGGKRKQPWDLTPALHFRGTPCTMSGMLTCFM